MPSSKENLEVLETKFLSDKDVQLKDQIENLKDDIKQSSDKTSLKIESQYCVIEKQWRHHEGSTTDPSVTQVKEFQRKTSEELRQRKEQENMTHIKKADKITQVYCDLKKEIEKTESKTIISEDKRMLVARIDKEGGTLTFGSISLKIPSGAVEEETILFIYNLGYRKSSGSIPLCTEVRCGPPGTKFNMYVTLSVELFGNIPKKGKPLVFCKEEGSDWKKIHEVGGNSFIKDNKSYTLVKHFSDFKTEVDQENFDESEAVKLVQISLNRGSFNSREELLIELRKLQICDPTMSSNSVKHFFCNQESAIEIEIGDRHIEYSIATLHNTNLLAVCSSISFSEDSISNINCKVGASVVHMNLIESPDNNFKKSQTNMSQNNIETVLAGIKNNLTDEFQKWLYKDFSEEEMSTMNIELAVTRYLTMNENDMRKLDSPLRQYGMGVVADKVRKIVEASPYDHTHRPLPSTPTDNILSLKSFAPGIPPRGKDVPDIDNGPKGICFESGRQSEIQGISSEKVSTKGCVHVDDVPENKTTTTSVYEEHNEPLYLNVKVDESLTRNEVVQQNEEVETKEKSGYMTYQSKK